MAQSFASAPISEGIPGTGSSGTRARYRTGDRWPETIRSCPSRQLLARGRRADTRLGEPLSGVNLPYRQCGRRGGVKIIEVVGTSPATTPVDAARCFDSAGLRSSGRQLLSADHVEPIKSHCGMSEEIGFFFTARAFCQKLAGIPKDRIAVGALVDREVALEHGARRAERLDACLHIGAPRRRQGFGGRRLGLLMKSKSTEAHAESADLDKHVGAGGQPPDRPSPGRKHLLALAAIRTDSDRTADVVEHDHHIRECTREICEFVNLGMK